MWTLEEDFEGYSTGALAGQGGWTVGSGTVPVSNADFNRGSQCLRFDTTLNSYAKRDIDNVTVDGSILYVSVKADAATTGGNSGIYLWETDGAGRIGDIYLRVNSGLKLSFREESGTWHDQFSLSTGVWYRIGMEFDFTNNRCRFNLDGGAWGSWVSWTNSRSYCGFIWIGSNGGATSNYHFWDSISAKYNAVTSVATTNKPPIDTLVSYWPLNEASGTRNDSHGSNNLTDNNTVGTAAGKRDGAADFIRANSEFLSITDASQVGLDINSDVTFAFWFNPDTTDAAGLITKYNYDLGNSGRAYAVEWKIDGDISLATSDGGANAQRAGWTGTGISTGSWYHIVVTLDLSAGTAELFVNGVSQGTKTGFPTSIVNNSQPFELAGNAGAGYHFDGKMDEVGIWTEILTQDHIDWLYNSGAGRTYFEVSTGGEPLSRGLISHWELEEASGTRVDSHRTNDLTDNNTVAQGAGIQGNGADFEASNSEYLSITDANQKKLDLGAGGADFTLALWYKPESLPTASTYQNFLWKWDGGANQRQYVIEFSYNGTNYTSSILLSSNGLAGAYANEVSLGSSFSTGTWYHFVHVYDASAGTLAVYVNGSLVNTHTGAPTSIFNGTSQVQMGSGQGYADGVFDEFAIWERALSPTEVSFLYNAGSGIPYLAPVATSNIKSIAGVTQANIKSIAGVAVANIKSVAGVTNT